MSYRHKNIVTLWQDIKRMADKGSFKIYHSKIMQLVVMAMDEIGEDAIRCYYCGVGPRRPLFIHKDSQGFSFLIHWT